jgi:hypothetical protein
MTTVEYEVLSPVGACLLRTPEHEIARAFVRERTRKVPGLTLQIHEVVTTVVRRRVGMRPQLKVVGA